MPSLRAIRKIGEGFLGLVLLAACVARAHAGDIRFNADVSSRRISQDESVSLTLSVTSEGAQKVDSVDFSAPDFDVINEFSSSYSSSYYNNGQFGFTVTQKLTKALRPRRTGTLLISKIRAISGGKALTSPDITIEVTAPGAGTPPPRNYGGNGVGLRGAGKRTNALTYFVRAEVNKDQAYKGEQVIVSYYLYRRASIFNIQVEKFPDLKGFLREEMEMPVMGTRLDSERVLLDGVAYERSLLTRYATYPLQEGKLKIDPIGLKFAYRPNGNGVDDDEDPFLQFFRQLPMRQTSARSETLTIDVQPLPQDGKPSNFTGGVGEFGITSAVNKYEVHANEAITLTAKVEGQGNVAAIGEPKVKWPDGIELYDSKGTSKTGKGGLGEKLFEFVVIPRVPGKVTLPPMEISFFNPMKKSYVTKTTDKIELTILDPLPGTAAAPIRVAPSAAAGDSPSVPKTEDVRYLKPFESVSSNALWNWIYGVAIAGSFGVIFWLLIDTINRKAGAARESRNTPESRVKFDPKRWDELKSLSRKAAGDGMAWSEVSGIYEQLSSQVLDSIDQATGVGARSLSRAELSRVLVQDHGCNGSLCSKITHLLEFAETVRFASALGAVSEQTARIKIEGWVKEGELIVQALGKIHSGSAKNCSPNRQPL